MLPAPACFSTHTAWPALIIPPSQLTAPPTLAPPTHRPCGASKHTHMHAASHHTPHTAQPSSHPSNTYLTFHRRRACSGATVILARSMGDANDVADRGSATQGSAACTRGLRRRLMTQRRTATDTADGSVWCHSRPDGVCSAPLSCSRVLWRLFSPRSLSLNVSVFLGVSPRALGRLGIR